jgi:hypothetical protein
VLEVDLLDNGFAVRGQATPTTRAQRVPWWTAPPGEQSGAVEIDGGSWLATRGAQVLCQPIAASAARERLRIRGAVAGAGCSLARWRGRRGAVEVGSPGASEAVEFETGAAELKTARPCARARRRSSCSRRGSGRALTRMQVLRAAAVSSNPRRARRDRREIDRIVRI